MSRCKACDKDLTEDELVFNPKTHQIEDLCFTCKGIAYRASKNLDLEMEDDSSLGEVSTYLDILKEDWDDE